MPLTINSNIVAQGAQRALNVSAMKSNNSLAKLSSGTRITTAKDDAAALSVANGLRLDVAALRAASTNVSQASSMLQVADGGFNQIGDVLTRMKTLATNAQSDQLSATERSFLNTEFTSLRSEITRIAESTEFNGIELLGGTAQHEAANVGTLVGTAQGFVGFEFNTGIRSAGESVRIAYNSTSAVMTVDVFSGASGGGNALGSQSIDLGSLAGNPFDIGGAANLPNGQTYTLDFSAIGVKLALNTTFDAGANIAGAAFANDGVNVVAGTATAGATLNFLVGVATTDTITANIGQGNAAALGLGTATVDNVGNAQAASNAIDAAMTTINTQRANLGAIMSRLDFAGANVAVQVENNEAARSVLYDVDVSAEMTEFTSKQVLVQAGVSMLAQANQQPSLMLRLLQ